MPGRPRHRSNHLFGAKRLSEVLAPLAGSGAEWFMTAACPLSRDSASPALALVVRRDGHELDRWPLHAMTYGSLVSQLVSQPSGPFAIPHASGFAYDEYAEVGNRLAAARAVLVKLIPRFNALLVRMSRTERMTGLSANQAHNWLIQAEHTLDATKGRELRQLIRDVGPPRFASHSSYLPELLPAVVRGTRLLEEFLATSLPPSSPAGPWELATQGTAESRWDWNDLTMDRRWAAGEPSWGELAELKFEYLPEVELVEYGSVEPEEPVPEIGLSAPDEAIHQPAPNNSARLQLLAIREQIDTLLTNLKD